VLVTHDLLLARRVCSRLVFLHAGRVVEDVAIDALSDVQSAPAQRLCRAGGILSEAR